MAEDWEYKSVKETLHLNETNIEEVIAKIRQHDAEMKGKIPSDNKVKASYVIQMFSAINY